MKIPFRRGALRKLAYLLAAAVLALGALSLPWHPEREERPPSLSRAAAGAGTLLAGAVQVPFDLPKRVPLGGFARLSYESDGVLDPVGVRALVLAVPGCKLALVSADLLLVPEALEEAVEASVADLRLDGIVVAATHTHAGPGGYWDSRLGARIATGPYDPNVRDSMVEAMERAIRGAARALAPALVTVARGRELDLVRSRSGGAEDGRLTVVRMEREEGEPLAELVIFPAHATILGKANRRISGDWPGRLMALGRRGLRLFFQGATGDQSTDGPTRTVDEYGGAVSARVDGLLFPPPERTTRLAFASVEVTLPSADLGVVPPPLRRAARTVTHGLLPKTGRVEAVRIADLVLVAVPGEPVASVASGWRSSLPRATEIISLANGYLGYVEEPARMAARKGETRLTYYGQDLARRLGEGVGLAARSVESEEERSQTPQAAGSEGYARQYHLE